MASSAATETLGLRQRTNNIMDSSFLSKFNSPVHRALMSTTAPVPYSFKEFKDLDIVEFSTLRQFGMLQYISMLQRHSVTADIFFWGVCNTDVTDERLLVTGIDGWSNVIGWDEIMITFGGNIQTRMNSAGIKSCIGNSRLTSPRSFCLKQLRRTSTKNCLTVESLLDAHGLLLPSCFARASV
ncbi:hypothetical protein R1sor_001586 [Riccia sorocarpa]|uniref:Uncharacterized protein n=1 Tax=Riccia sorocarpa TaxID=122646 RepID=A0ABD3GZ09_9MARC